MPVPISNVTRRAVYAPSGAGGAGPYAFTFEILANTDIAVYKDDVLLTLTTHYTVTINANGTGSVTITAAGLALSPTSPTQYAIVGNRTIQRTTDFVTGGDFFANTLNDELDQQTIFSQQNAEGLQRALQAPQTDPTTINMTLPGRTARANKTLSFDANGDPTPGVSAADVANAVTYATNAANSATAAAASASAASSSASSASGSASTATTQASNASTSATNAANSASAASTSATNAASSASTAATQASNASTSATNAASSASAASTSASNAATSATNASNSASSASTSATNAANSATAAASSASSAAASAASAATALDSFDDRYLGTKASDPTLDNDGNALVSGALYFSTSQNIMKVYDGASWIAATSAGNTSLLRFRYIATAGQTSFSGADSNSATLTYTVNNIVVFLNGVALDQTEYTATNGTSVVLTTGAALNDELVIVAFKSFVTADMVPASTGGTYAGAVRFAAGSASVPSISVDGDTNTGIFFPAADTVAIGTGGVQRVTADSSGNLRLNTSTGELQLAVGAERTITPSGSSGSTALTFKRWNGSSYVSDVVMDASGRFGVGTTTPNAVGANWKGLSVGVAGIQGGGTATFGSNLQTNSYYNGSNWIRVETGGTAHMEFDGTGFKWFSDGSGSAGIFTPTERARITSGGDFVVGCTSAPGRFGVSGSGGGASADLVLDTNASYSEIQSYNIKPLYINRQGNNVIINSTSGNLLVGTTSSLYGGVIQANAIGTGSTATLKNTEWSTFPLHLWNASTSNDSRFVSFATQGTYTERGSIDFNRGATLTRYNTTSDGTLKNIIGDSDGQRSLEILSTTRIREFAWKDDEQQKPQIGVIAQELYETYKGAVSVGGDIEKTDEEGNVTTEYRPWGVDKTAFTFHLIAGWQAHEKMIQELKAEIAALKAQP